MLARPLATTMLPDLAATHALACAVAGCMRAGDAILLDGPLGAGKSELARALLRAATGDIALEVPSPTFTLVQSYDTPRGPVHHYDLWRLDGPDALDELGWDAARADIVLVEWPDRLGGLAPEDALRIGLSHAPDLPEARVATISGWDGRLVGFVETASGIHPSPGPSHGGRGEASFPPPPVGGAGGGVAATDGSTVTRTRSP